MNPFRILNINDQADEYFSHLFNALITNKIKEEKIGDQIKLPLIDELLNLSEEEIEGKIHFLDNNKENFINHNNYLLLRAIFLYFKIKRDDAINYIKKAKLLEAENPLWDFIDVILRSDFEVGSFNLSIIENIPFIRQNPYAENIISFIKKCQQLEKSVNYETSINKLFELQKEVDPEYIHFSNTLAAITSIRNFDFNKAPDLIAPEDANNDKIKAIISKGLNKNSNNEPLWHIFNAWLKLHNKEYNHAINIFKWIQNKLNKINNFDPTLHWSWIGLYKIYTYTGNEYQAIEALEKYLSWMHFFDNIELGSIDPEFPYLTPERTNLILHDFYKQQGDYQSALRRVSEIWECHHYRLDNTLNYFTVVNMYADLLYLLNSHDESLYYYYRLLDLDPYNENIKKRIKKLSSITIREEEYFKRYPTYDMKDQFLKFAKSHFHKFNKVICSFFPFSYELLEELQDKLNWDSLSSNRAILWNTELINKYRNKLNFQVLSENPSLPWDKNLIFQFRDKWDWEELSSNTDIIWTKELMIQFRDYLYFMGDFDGMSANTSVLWSEDILDEFEKLLDWKLISENINIPWSKELIEKYEEKWYWEYLSGNPAIPWDDKLIEKYINYWDWEALSFNKGIKFNYLILKKFEEKWDWDTLVANENFPWTKHIIENFKHRIPEGKIQNNEELSIYKGIKNIQNNKIINDTSSYFNPYFSKEFLVKYFDYIDFASKNIIVDEELYAAIKKYHGTEALNEESHRIVFEKAVLSKYIDELDWDGICRNKNYNWSLNFILKFIDYINIEQLSTQIIEKVSFPYLDEDAVIKFYKH
ncbi:MAG: hypothetical protein ACOCP4_03505 [Candidatus Woesearchaeota archaeon]